MSTSFTPEQVLALCGGSFPGQSGFAWDRVERFELEGGILQPYAGREILPGPGISLEATLADWP